MSLRLMYSPILTRSIAQVLLLNHLPSQDLGIRRYNKKWVETFPWLEFDEIYRMHSGNYAKRVEDLFRGLVGLGLPNHSLTGKRRLRK